MDENEKVNFKVYANTATADDDDADVLISLTILKNIFSRQLPKMPKEYIVRLVFDRRHKTLAIRRGEKIIGGICYRSYYPQRFAEIAFCAVSATEQVKGYGTILMNQLKAYVQPEGIEYFLTYADNFAIGYFQKQGFSKVIAMPKDRWLGFIKDYDGGTLMECYIHPNVDYLNIQSIIDKQRKFIYSLLEKRSHSSIIYENGEELFHNDKRYHLATEIPAVAAAGWKYSSLHRGVTERDRNNTLARLASTLKTLYDKVRSSRHISCIAAQSSCDITLWMIEERIKAGLLADKQQLVMYYRSKEMLKADLLHMVTNSLDI